MKILLINPGNPPGSGRDLFTMELFSSLHNFKVNKKINFGLPLALPTLAAVTPPRHTVEIIDEMIEPIDFDKKYDLIGITAMTFKANRAFQIAAEFRKRGSPVIMGGIHASVCPDEVARHVDSVVIGEADQIWPQILQDFEKGILNKRYTAKRAPDISKIPPPRYDLISRDSYLVFFVQTTRGCPHSCKFCTVTAFNGKTIRKKTPEQVIHEIEKLRQVCDFPWAFIDKDDQGKKKKTIPTIFFTDDNFAINRKHALSLCCALKKYQEKNNLILLWFTQVNYQTGFDDELLLAMRSAGCQLLFIGFESLEEGALKSMKKTMNSPKRYAASIKNIKRHGLEVCYSTIFGNEYDSICVGDKLADFIDKNDVFLVLPNILTPYPGTALRDEMDRDNRVLQTNSDYYNIRNVVFKPQRMSPYELQRVYTTFCERVFKFENALKRAKASLKYPKRSLLPWPLRFVILISFSMTAIRLTLHRRMKPNILFKLLLTGPSFIIRDGHTMAFFFLGMSADYDDFSRSEKKRFLNNTATVCPEQFGH